MNNIQAEIPNQLKEKLRIYCCTQHTAQRDVIVQALELFFSQVKENELCKK